MHLPAGIEWIIILVVVLLVFGPKKLPQLAKGAGEAVKEFKEASKSEEDKLAEARALIAKAEADAKAKAAKSAEAEGSKEG